MKFEQYLIEKESDELKTKLKDSDDYLKAPNGKPSNLLEKQWLMVRTKSFKNWFGDWEKNPDSASKIIDENGEPMIVYHSALSRVNEFKPHGQFMGYTGISGISVTDTKAMAERYLDRYGEYGWIDGKANQKFDKHTMSLFVNARNPLYRDEPFKSNISLGAPLPKDYKPMLPNGCDALIRNDAISRKGGVKHSTAKNAIRGKEIVLLNPNQVKSIDNKGEFSKSSNNINEHNNEI